MERVEAYVPPPLEKDISEYQQENGFENRSQAIRSLLRSGLDA